jgi:hypothetical protein
MPLPQPIPLPDLSIHEWKDRHAKVPQRERNQCKESLFSDSKMFHEFGEADSDGEFASEQEIPNDPESPWDNGAPLVALEKARETEEEFRTEIQKEIKKTCDEVCPAFNEI